MNLRNYHTNDVDQADGAAAPEKRQAPPDREGNPWEPWHGNPWGIDDKEKRPDAAPDDDKVKRSDETTEGNPWAPWHGNPWTDDKEKRQHEPHKDGNPWGPWT